MLETFDISTMAPLCRCVFCVCTLICLNRGLQKQNSYYTRTFNQILKQEA